MKWVLCVVIFICAFMTIVNGAKPNKQNKDKEIRFGLTVDSKLVIYGPNETFLDEGIKNKKITCTGSHRSQKIEWYDPEGNLVEQGRSGLVYAEPALSRGIPSVSLVLSTTRVSESGVWECRSGKEVQKVSLCIIDTPEVEEDEDLVIEIDEGRSITLKCKGKGNPEPRIQWYKENQLLTDDGEKYYTSTMYNQHDLEGLLTIKSVDAADMGVYNCETIQENPELVDCSNTVVTSITLNVNHAPKELYEPDKTSLIVPMVGMEGVNYTLICSPSAYPAPEFRWFSSNMATEYTNRHFLVSTLENGTWSVFPLTANSSTYNKEFICKAKNDYGELTITYVIIKAQKPPTLSATSEFIARERTMYFNITWDEDIDFEVEGIDIQYFEKVTIGEPRYWQWETARVVEYPYETIVSKYYDYAFLVPLKNLRVNTEYWVRLRAYNELGRASWSKHILASTAYDDAPQSAGSTSGVFIGVIGIAVIIVFAGGCITIIKKL